MRIEKINEKQIRCTLNQKDLKDREIGLSELAYGTAKAKALFQDMMQQASYEFGFQADDIPLMIEAIPLLPEALILIITKVEEPDELDTRFSSFTEENNWYEEEEEEFIYKDIYDDTEHMELLDEEEDTDSEWNYPLESSKETSSNHLEDDFISLPEMLGMEQNLDSITQLACQISNFYHGKNTLYKDTATGTYYLIIHRSDHSSEEFAKICNILHEYGEIEKSSSYSQYYFEEHFTPILAEHAIETLASL